MHSLPVSTVKFRLQRAKQKIRTQIKNSCFLTTDTYGNIVDFVRPVKKNMTSSCVFFAPASSVV